MYFVAECIESYCHDHGQCLHQRDLVIKHYRIQQGVGEYFQLAFVIQSDDGVEIG